MLRLFDGTPGLDKVIPLEEAWLEARGRHQRLWEASRVTGETQVRDTLLKQPPAVVEDLTRALLAAWLVTEEAADDDYRFNLLVAAGLLGGWRIVVAALGQLVAAAAERRPLRVGVMVRLLRLVGRLARQHVRAPVEAVLPAVLRHVESAAAAATVWRELASDWAVWLEWGLAGSLVMALVRLGHPPLAFLSSANPAGGRMVQACGRDLLFHLSLQPSAASLLRQWRTQGVVAKVAGTPAALVSEGISFETERRASWLLRQPDAAVRRNLGHYVAWLGVQAQPSPFLRWLCRRWHPSNADLRAKLLPRWRLAAAVCHTQPQWLAPALLVDWWGEEEDVMSLEPAALLLVYGPAQTALPLLQQLAEALAASPVVRRSAALMVQKGVLPHGWGPVLRRSHVPPPLRAQLQPVLEPPPRGLAALEAALQAAGWRRDHCALLREDGGNSLVKDRRRRYAQQRGPAPGADVVGPALQQALEAGASVFLAVVEGVATVWPEVVVGQETVLQPLVEQLTLWPHALRLWSEALLRGELTLLVPQLGWLLLPTLQWESTEQAAFWQLLQAERWALPAARLADLEGPLLELLPLLEASHDEAMQGLLLVLRTLPPTRAMVVAACAAGTPAVFDSLRLSWVAAGQGEVVRAVVATLVEEWRPPLGGKRRRLSDEDEQVCSHLAAALADDRWVLE